MKTLKWLWVIVALIAMSAFLWGCSDNVNAATVVISHDAYYKAPCTGQWYIVKMEIQGDTANITAACVKQAPSNEVKPATQDTTKQGS